MAKTIVHVHVNYSCDIYVSVYVCKCVCVFLCLFICLFTCLENGEQVGRFAKRYESFSLYLLASLTLHFYSKLKTQQSSMIFYLVDSLGISCLKEGHFVPLKSRVLAHWLVSMLVGT